MQKYIDKTKEGWFEAEKIIDNWVIKVAEKVYGLMEEKVNRITDMFFLHYSSDVVGKKFIVERIGIDSNNQEKKENQIFGVLFYPIDGFPRGNRWDTWVFLDSWFKGG